VTQLVANDAQQLVLVQSIHQRRVEDDHVRFAKSKGNGIDHRALDHEDSGAGHRKTIPQLGHKWIEVRELRRSDLGCMRQLLCRAQTGKHCRQEQHAHAGHAGRPGKQTRGADGHEQQDQPYSKSETFAGMAMRRQLPIVEDPFVARSWGGECPQRSVGAKLRRGLGSGVAQAPILRSDGAPEGELELRDFVNPLLQLA